MEISKNYQTPQKKQSNSLDKYAQSQEEYNFSVVIATPPIAIMCEVEKNYVNKLIDVLTKWRWMSGTNSYNQEEDEIGQELALISKFILSNYSTISLDEISLAIDLSLTDKLNVDVRTFNTFSPMYVSRILNAYLEYKRRMYNEIMERKNKVDSREEMEKKVSPKEKMDSMVELIEYFYEQYKSEGTINDYFNTLYNYLRRTKKLNPSKEVVNEAMEYGKSMATEHINSFFGKGLFDEKPNKDNIGKRFARNYCVQKYFDGIDIKEVISSIDIKEFE